MPSSPDQQIDEQQESSGEALVSELVKMKPKKLKKGPKLTNKINPDYEFPDEPQEFKERYASIPWASSEHDELGKKLFKSKEAVTHSEDFSKFFPRYSVVKQNKRASKAYARRKVNAFLHKKKAAEVAAELESTADD